MEGCNFKNRNSCIWGCSKAILTVAATKSLSNVFPRTYCYKSRQQCTVKTDRFYVYKKPNFVVLRSPLRSACNISSVIPSLGC